MKSLLVWLTTILVSVAVTACGSCNDAASKAPSDAATSTAATSASDTSTQDYTKADRDKDNDFSPADDTNNNGLLANSHPPSAGDRLAITALVKRYYVAASAGNGSKACSMLYITLAESAVEDYGHGSAGPSYLSQATSCPAVTSLLFKHYHSQLTAELPLLKVRRILLVQRHGLAILSFGTMPEREIGVRKEAHTWKIGALLDGALP